MSDRDWSKELAKIDRQLESISDAELAPSRPAGVPPTPAAAGAPVERRGVERKGSSLGAFLRLALSVALGVGILFWPYDARCGFGLFAYLAAVGVVTASGVWSAVWTWRHRTSQGHILSLLLILWGLVLGSVEVLPRVGYAKAVIGRPTMWMCQ